MSSMEQQWMPDAGSTFEPGNGSFTGHIFDAEWATDAGYLAGSVLRLLWKIKVSEPLDWSAFDGTDVFNCWWTIGAGWETHDGGRTVVNTDDTPALLKGFRNNTLYSRILGWAAKAQLKERINEAGGPRVAAAWTGLSLRFEPDTYEVGTREERTTRTRGFPTAV